MPLILLALACAPTDADTHNEGSSTLEAPIAPLVVGFVGTAADLAVAQDWWVDMAADPTTIVGGAPELFERVFVQVDASAEPIVGDCEPGVMKDYCIRAEALRALEEEVGATDLWVAFWDVESIVAASTPEGVVITRLFTYTVLDHELGHALVGLADEYSAGSGAFDPSNEPMAGGWSSESNYVEHWALTREPNLTTDPMGGKWAPYDGAPVEGGKLFESGLFHPEESCRMNADDRDPFCAVCRREVDRFYRSRRGNDGPPQCELRFDADAAVWEAFGTDFDGLQVSVASAEPLYDLAVSLGSFQMIDSVPPQATSLTLRCQDDEGLVTEVVAELGEDVRFTKTTF